MSVAPAETRPAVDSAATIRQEIILGAIAELLTYATETLGALEGRVAAGQLEDGRVYLHVAGRLFTFSRGTPVDAGEYELIVPHLN